MKALLIMKKLWRAVIEDEKYRKLDDAAKTELSEQARALMILSISKSVKGLIIHEKSASAAWELLKGYFQQTTRARATDLHTKLMMVRQGPKEKIIEYLLKIFDLRTQLVEVGENVTDALVISATLNGLQRKYAQVAETLRCQTDLRWDVLGSRLVAAEGRLEDRDEQGKVMFHKGTKKGPTREEKRTCFNCGEKGHIKKDCKKPASKKDGKEPAKESDGTALAVVGAAADSWRQMPNEGILIDTGASHHICHALEMFVDMCESPIATVVCGGGEVHAVRGQGTVRLTSSHGVVRLIDALYVPTLCANLLSWPAASGRGASLKGQGTALSIEMDGRTLLTAEKRNGVFLVDGALEQSNASAYAVKASVWHKRLGHLSNGVLSKMVTDEMVLGLHIDGALQPEDACDACFEGKQARLPFEQSTSRATRVLELVHSDLSGKMQVRTIGGARYFLTMLDDYSRYSEVVCVAHKSDVPEALLAILRKWERKTDLKVRTLRTDGGGEYLGELAEALKNEGIEHQMSTRYTPQQNGRAERLNRTLMDKTRSMLFEAGLPNKFWGEAILTANHLRNVTATATTDATPIEAFTGRKPDVSMLRVFGCVAHVQIPGELRKKLDRRSMKTMFVGYEEGRKGWKTLRKEDHQWKSVITRDAVFEEDKMAYEHLTSENEDDIPEEVGPLMEQFPGEEDADEDLPVPGRDDSTDEEEMREDLVPTSTRTRRLQDIVSGVAMATKKHDWNEWDNPPSLDVVRSRQDAELWEQSMVEELMSLAEKGVYEEVELPPGKKALPSKWVYKIKRDEKGKVERYKSRYVAKGFLQKIDEETTITHAPTSSAITFRILLAMAAENDWEIDQLDVKTAFLNGELEEELYMRPPPGFDKHGRVWRLKRAIYGLRQAASAWHAKLQKALTGADFQISESDPCLYTYTHQGEQVYVVIHVDDCLVFGGKAGVDCAKAIIMSLFEVKDGGPVVFFLGMQVIRDRKRRTLWLGQTQYAKDILQRFGMSECKARTSPLDNNFQLTEEGELLDVDQPYSAMVGSLLYLAMQTRPDIAHAVCMMARFVSAPRDQHWAAGKSVLRYLAGTVDLGLLYGQTQELTGYTDSDFAGDKIARKSTSGMVFTMNGAAVSWSSKLQTVVATSTCEAEMIAASAAVKEGLYISKVMADITGSYNPTLIYGDNQAALALMKNVCAGAQNRTKHFDVALNFARYRVMLGDTVMRYIATGKMVADVMTKQVPGPAFRKHRDALGVRRVEDAE